MEFSFSAIKVLSLSLSGSFCWTNKSAECLYGNWDTKVKYIKWLHPFMSKKDMPFPRNPRYIFRNYTLTRWSKLKWSQKSHLKLLDLFIMQRDHPSGNYRYHWLVKRTMNIRYNWPYVLDEQIVVRQIVIRSNVYLKIHWTLFYFI